VVQSGLQQVCNEMDLAFVRAAFSPVISEALDRSDGIYHRDDGALIAQGDLGLPVFVGTMQFGTRAVIERAKDLKPGDMYIVNDPYMGGTHLMDVRFAKPFFYEGEIFAWLANTGHWPDTGGMVPGGFSAQATESEQEGLRLPPVKLFKEGVMDEEILSIILSNIRIADQRIGDIKAQAAALTVGERQFTALLDRYGKDTVEACIVELRARAEQQMRAKIATIPDGNYHGVAFVDSDGIVDEPLKIDMNITKRDTDLHFDMSGSSPPRHRDHAVVRVPRHEAHIPRRTDQCGNLRPAAYRGPGGHLPLRALSAARIGLCGGSQSAHRRGCLRGIDPRPARPAFRRAGRHQRQFRAGRPRPQDRQGLCALSDFRRRLWRQHG
jgi:N-methylhydantoinase B